MTWSAAHIEEKKETNAEGVTILLVRSLFEVFSIFQRARQQKIKDLIKYNGVLPGKLNISVKNIYASIFHGLSYFRLTITVAV